MKSFKEFILESNSIDYSIISDRKGGFSVYADDLDSGKTIGSMYIPKSNISRTSFIVDDIEVSEDYRRRGIATEMYNFAERELKKKAKPNRVQLADGESFWNNRKKQQSASPTKSSTWVGVCDKVRHDDAGEQFWQHMMDTRQKISEREFLKHIDPSNILDDGESWQDWVEEKRMNDPDFAFYRSDDDVYFAQYAGFEFIWRAK